MLCLSGCVQNRLWQSTDYLGRLRLLRIFDIEVKEQAEETRRRNSESVKCAVLKIDLLVACLPGSLLLGLALKVLKFWGQCWDVSQSAR